MKGRDESSRKQPYYGRFAAALMLYILGVAAFAAWTFVEHLSAIESGADPAQAHSQRMMLIEGAKILFLLAMAFPLIVSYHRAKVSSINDMAELNRKLEQDCRKLRKRETELEQAIQDLERFNALATGREERIMELKSEVNNLLREMDRPNRYTTAPGK